MSLTLWETGGRGKEVVWNLWQAPKENHNVGHRVLKQGHAIRLWRDSSRCIGGTWAKWAFCPCGPIWARVLNHRVSARFLWVCQSIKSYGSGSNSQKTQNRTSSTKLIQEEKICVHCMSRGHHITHHGFTSHFTQLPYMPTWGLCSVS